MTPVQPRGQPQQAQQSPLPSLEQLMAMYDPKELQMLGQALTSLLKVQAALQPKPSPQEQMMQPSPLDQLAAMDLHRRRQEAQQRQMRMQSGPQMAMQGMPMNAMT